MRALLFMTVLLVGACGDDGPSPDGAVDGSGPRTDASADSGFPADAESSDFECPNEAPEDADSCEGIVAEETVCEYDSVTCVCTPGSGEADIPPRWSCSTE